MTGIKGVIFDFNGTLFWDTELHNKAWDGFLEKHKIRLSHEEKDLKIHGKNNRQILTNLFSRELTPEDIDQLSVEKEDIYQSLCLKQSMELAPGSISFMEFLSTNGIPYTIATASDRYNVDFYFRHLNLDDYFDRSKVVYSDGTVKSKPDPQIFNRAAGILEVHCGDTLIFEDSYSGIQAAENAKAGKIIIVDSNNTSYEQWDHQVIKDFAEVDRHLFDIN